MAQTFAGRTPKGHELYREVGGNQWFVREPVREKPPSLLMRSA